MENSDTVQSGVTRGRYLPPEIWISILSHTNRKDLLTNCRLVSKSFKALVDIVERAIDRQIRSLTLEFLCPDDLFAPFHRRLPPRPFETRLDRKTVIAARFVTFSANGRYAYFVYSLNPLHRFNAWDASWSRHLKSPNAEFAPSLHARGPKIYLDILQRRICLDWKALLLRGYEQVFLCDGRPEYGTRFYKHICLSQDLRWHVQDSVKMPNGVILWQPPGLRSK